MNIAIGIIRVDCCSVFSQKPQADVDNFTDCPSVENLTTQADVDIISELVFVDVSVKDEYNIAVEVFLQNLSLIAAHEICTVAVDTINDNEQMKAVLFSEGTEISMIVTSGVHAPTAVETDGEASNPGPRLRRRGPRSIEAQQRRQVRWCRRHQQALVGRSATAIFEEEHVSIMHVNVQGWISNSTELTACIRMTDPKPLLVCCNETFLNQSIEEISLEGYSLVGRRDRRDQFGGGVAIFAATAHAGRVTLVHESEEAERLWCIIHSDHGPVAVCAWYRPPARAEIRSIDSFSKEWRDISNSCIGTIAVGDINVHSRRWLHHSSGETVEGTALQAACVTLGAQQLVRSPTRGENLLDLVLTDIEGVKARVVPGVSDHDIVVASLKLSVPETEVSEREVWDFGKGDWDGLHDASVESDWSFIARVDTDRAASDLTADILAKAERFIPRRQLKERKTTHPWLSDRAIDAVKDKHAARGSVNELFAAQRCSQILLEERMKFQRRMCDELSQLPKGSKQYWSRSRQLMDRKSSTTSVPALKRPDGTWLLSSQEKANHFAEVFAAKCRLPAQAQGAYSEICQASVQQSLGPLPDDALAFEKLRELDVTSALGPDLLPTRLLRFCASALAKPVASLARRIIQMGRWPEAWLVHWMVPIFKRASVFSAKNYRGVHLTSQLSKVVERIVQTMYAPFLTATVAFGPNQFAYCPGRGSRDAIAVLVLTWLLGFDEHLKYGVYCSDVAGAFDKVKRQRLIDKLKAKGLAPQIVAVIASWLRDRTAYVVVGNTRSQQQILKDMVFQGTVLGPGLWNLMYEDARKPIQNCGFTEIVYADDLNAYRAFKRSISNAEVLAQMDVCQSELHCWGGCNQVEFDPSKESMHILSRDEPHGGSFKIFGIKFDCKLCMTEAVAETVDATSWKLSTLLRSRRYFCDADMVCHYKSQILSFVEYRTPGIYHACSSSLSRLDAVQHRFLERIGVSAKDALFCFNLAPLSSRRDIAMLGVIHRSVLGLGPDQLKQFFCRDNEYTVNATRLGRRRHSRQLVDRRGAQFTEQFRRSALGLVAIYNLLPEEIVMAPTVALFQSQLQNLLRTHAMSSQEWQDLFTPRIPLYCHPLLQY